MLRRERLLAMRAARHRQLTLLVVLHPAGATIVDTDNLGRAETAKRQHSVPDASNVYRLSRSAYT